MPTSLLYPDPVLRGVAGHAAFIDLRLLAAVDFNPPVAAPPPNQLGSQPNLVVVIKHGGSRHDEQAIPFD
jgi:hypothetical protein